MPKTLKRVSKDATDLGGSNLVSGTQLHFNFLKKTDLSHTDKTQRDRIHHELAGHIQAAIAIGEKHGLLCKMRHQPVLENLPPEAIAVMTLEEKATLRKARHARNKLIETHMRLVTKIATKEHRKASSRVELLDLVQDGVFGLVRACEKFDPTRGYSFSTYAYRWIWQTVLVGLNSEERLIKLSSTRLDLIRRYERGEFVPETEEERCEVNQLMIVYQFPISLNWVSGGEESGREIFEQLADPASECSVALEGEADSEAVEVAQIRRALENIPSGQRMALQAEFCLGWFARFENGKKQPTAAARCIRIEQRLKEWMRAGEGGPEWSEDSLSKAWIKAWYEEGLVNMRAALETLQGWEGR